MPYFSSRFFSLCQHCSQKFHLQFFVLESWFVYFRSLLKEWNAKEDCHMPSLLFLRGALFFQNHWLVYEKPLPQQLQWVIHTWFSDVCLEHFGCSIKSFSKFFFFFFKCATVVSIAFFLWWMFVDRTLELYSTELLTSWSWSRFRENQPNCRI